MRHRILLAVLLPATVVAQSRAGGRVARITGRDTVAVPGIAVVLHRVGPQAQGPLDTVVAGRDGSFALRFAPDSQAVYLLSARYAGIEYFSQPLATNPARPDTAIVLIVADTSSTTPIQIRQRTLLISGPDASGTRTVLDWFVLSNPGTATRVAPDTIRASWATPLPPEAQNVEIADSRMSQFSAEVLGFRKDSALIFAPLSPGDKELMLQYRIPGTLRRFVVPSERVVDSVFVMLEEPGARVATRQFVPADSQNLEGRLFRRWKGTFAGGTLDISLPSALLSSKQTLAVLVGALALGFAGLVLFLRARRRRPALVSAGPAPGALTDAIARLDAKYLGREHETTSEEWEAYQAERVRLKGLLVSALATPQQRS